MFSVGRHKDTFENVCLEDNIIMLNDELLEFFAYVEDSTDDTVKNSKGKFMKNIHRRVNEVKSDISVEVHIFSNINTSCFRSTPGGLCEGK